MENSETKPPQNPTPSARHVLFAFYGTQFLLFVVSVPLMWWMEKWNGSFFSFDDMHMWGWGLGTGLGIALVNMAMVRWLPRNLMDDGGINEILFADRSIMHIFFIAALSGFCEELFFRGVIQEWLGVMGTSILFVLVHTRYLKKWPLVLVVGAISIWFGFLVEMTGQLTPAIIAHASANFISGTTLRFLSKKESQ